MKPKKDEAVEKIYEAFCDIVGYAMPLKIKDWQYCEPYAYLAKRARKLKKELGLK